MGMYTELILGAELKKDTPKEVVDILKGMAKGKRIWKKSVLPKHEFFQAERWQWLFTMGSFYFGVHNGYAEIWFEDICDSWHISSRSNIKNYDSEIEKFLDWIKPYIDQGTGYRDFYALVTYEESEEPTIYYLDEYSEENEV